MQLDQLKPGDTVFATQEIRNDGSIPDCPEDALIAKVGSRGVLIETGHLEEDPEQAIYLVRFENDNLDLGPPTGCWPTELSPDEPQ